MMQPRSATRRSLDNECGGRPVVTVVMLVATRVEGMPDVGKAEVLSALGAVGYLPSREKDIH